MAVSRESQQDGRDKPAHDKFMVRSDRKPQGCALRLQAVRHEQLIHRLGLCDHALLTGVANLCFERLAVGRIRHSLTDRNRKARARWSNSSQAMESVIRFTSIWP